MDRAFGNRSKSSTNSFCEETKVSIIVPTYNGSKKISACLKALLAQKTKRPFEIIVVDDGSTDNTIEVVSRFPEIKLLRQSNSGPAVARNQGVREAQGKIVLFTDDDCIPEPDWLEEMLKPFTLATISGVKGAYKTVQKELIARFVQIEYEEKYDCLRRNKWIDFIDTYSAAFSRDIFLAAGGYDERFSTASTEDQEFSFRLSNQGYKMVFTPKARVHHTHVASFLGYLKKKHKIGYWKVLTLHKNRSKAMGDSHTPRTLKLQIALTAIFIPSLGALLVGPPGLLLPLAVFSIYGASMVPLCLRCIKKDVAVGLAAPLFITCRSIGLTTGLIRGMVRFGLFHSFK